MNSDTGNKKPINYKLVALFYNIYAGLHVFGIGFLAIHAFVFIKFMIPEMEKQKNTAEMISILKVALPIMYSVIGILILASAVMALISAYQWKKEKYGTFQFVYSIISIMSFPVGTALGIYSLMMGERHEENNKN